MKFQGKIFGMTTHGDLVDFAVRAENNQDVRVQASKALVEGLREGDAVAVEGKSQTDPPFLAESIVKLDRAAEPRKFPWKWIAAAAAVILVLLLVSVFLRKGPSGDAAVVKDTTPAVPAVPASAPAPALPSGRLAIENAHSGLCLSPAGGVRDNNAAIVQFTCDQDPSRFWSFTVVSDDVVKIVNANSGLCLTVAGGVNDRNAVSVQYTCDDDPSRRWRYVADGTVSRLVNVHSGLCLTIAGGGIGINTTAVQFPCDGDPSRNWKIRS